MAAPYVFIVSARDNEKPVFSPTAVSLSPTCDFVELFRAATIYTQMNLSADAIDHAKTSVGSGGKDHSAVRIPDLSIPLQFAVDISQRHVEFVLNTDRLPTNPDSARGDGPACGSRNAFSVLLSARKKILLPRKPEYELDKKLSGPQQLLCDLIDWGGSLECEWTQDTLASGEAVFDKLTAALWYIDHAHAKFKENGCSIPDCFKQFQGYNRYKQLRHKVPVIKSQRLLEVTEDLINVVSLPSMSVGRNKKLGENIENLITALNKYHKRLTKDNDQHKTNYQQRPEANEGDTTCTFVSSDKNNNAIKDIYLPLDHKIKEMKDFEYISVDEFCPSDRYKRRAYIKGLNVSKPVMLYRVAFGGSVGTLNFIWSVPSGDTSDRTQRNFEVIKHISDLLPKFSSRFMRREFIEKYINFVKCPKSVLRNMYFKLTGFEETAESSEQHVIDMRVARKLINADDTDLLLDLRATNGSETYFDEFFDEMSKYFEEQLLQVHERRQSQELYLPFAISIETLKEEICKRLPDDTPVPSTETIRLQFSPSNPFQKTALRYTGRFNVKFRVQTRQARVDHVDAHYAAKLFQYVKEFSVKHSDHCIFVCMDDKAIVPVGEPGIPISTGVRGHNKVLAPSEGPQLVCTDHDFHLAGLVPSVALVCDIPESPKDSFFSGNMFVTTKDKVFSPSSPQRHAAELTRILRENFSNNEVDLNNPILCIMTDGGPDHRLTYESVKASLLLIFMQLDLDMLIAIRTAPSQSWTNPAERCMSILNLALQHVALDRAEMDGKFEKMVKNKSSLNAVRNASNIYPGLREAFEKSMDSVIRKVSQRFAKLSLKGQKIQSLQGASNTDIKQFTDMLQRVGLATDDDNLSSGKSADFKKMKALQSFLKTHAVSSHYCFQVRKCQENDCAYCFMNPVRDPELYQEVHFIPEPTPDASNEHYQPFSEMYGKPLTTDKFRPSARNGGDFGDDAEESDRQNREMFKVQRLRDVICCGECGKPRCVFCAKKTDRNQDELLQSIRSEQSYVCGDSLPENSELVIRQCLSCMSDIETSYFAAKCRRYLPPVCVYCGTEEELLDDNNEYIADLYTKFSVVRPLCSRCHANGKTAKTWGIKFLKKKK